MNNPRSPFTRSQGVFGSLGSFDIPPEVSTDKNGLNSVRFLNKIQTSPRLSRPMGHPYFPPMEDSDGFNSVSQQSMGWAGGASVGSFGAMGVNYYDDRYEGQPDARYEGHYEGDYLTRIAEEQACLCQDQIGRDYRSVQYPDTESETEELCRRPPPRPSRLEYLGTLVTPKTRQRIVSVYQFLSRTIMFKVMLLVLQLLCYVVAWLVGKAVGLCNYFGAASIRLWISTFKLRAIQRQLLWRMANARGDETLVFLCVLLTTPWLFLLSLLGFTLSAMVLLKKTLEQLAFQIRLHLVL